MKRKNERVKRKGKIGVVTGREKQMNWEGEGSIDRAVGSRVVAVRRLARGYSG